MTSNSKSEGRFGKQDFVYVGADDIYLCPAGERLSYRYTNEEDRKTLRRYWTTACQACTVKSKCTTGKERMGGLGKWRGQEFHAALNWHTVKLIKERYNIPLVLKGIATAEDTRIAVVSDRLVVVPHEQGQQADPLAHTGLQLRPERARVSSRRAAGFGPAPL